MTWTWSRFMADGVHFGEHTCVVALGIDIDGVKHPLAVEEGSTENATLVTDLITGLRDRGLDVTRPILAVLDGAKALSRAVRDVSGQAAHPAVPAAQDQKREGQVAGQAADRRRAADAPGLPRRIGPQGRGPAGPSWRASWPRPTPAPPPRCARAWPRP